MPPGPTVRLEHYRWAGRFLFLRIRSRCEECDLTHVVLERLMSEVFADKPVTLATRPWLNHWWKIFWRGAWRAPVVMLDGRVFCQGVVPDVQELITAVAHILGDADLEDRVDLYAGKKEVQEDTRNIVVYHSPACPHCHRLREYLVANGVPHALKDVTESRSARDQVNALTGRMAIPVLKTPDGVLTGFDQEQVRRLLRIHPDAERHGAAELSTRPPMVDQEVLVGTVEAAKELLRVNCMGGRTQASCHLYPHQWNWDAGFIARGYLHFDPEQAYREIRLLFEGQWSDGFLPHIIFNPLYLDHFPGPDYWHGERSGRVPEGTYTSGISQPPVHASMLAAAPDLDPDAGRARRFLAEMYPRLKALHDCFFSHRDPDGEGLVCLVHPWESGIDNVPIWDEPLSAIENTSPWAQAMQNRYDELVEEGERPRRSYIEKYSYLVEHLFSRDYDWARITRDHPFLVQDVLFNAILCRAESDLALIAEIVGENSEPHRLRAERLAEAVNAKLWDEESGLYYSYDMVAGRLIKRDTIFSYVPLYAGVCDAARASRLLSSLKTHCYCLADRHCVGIPSYDMCQADCDGEFLWRGPIWFNMCWCLAQGFRAHGEDEQAAWLEDSLLQLVIDQGFYEYYEPETGKGLGADGFSWTAALFIDLAASRAR